MWTMRAKVKTKADQNFQWNGRAVVTDSEQ